MAGAEDDDCRGERGGCVAGAEVEAATDEPHLGGTHRAVVPPTGVGAGGDKADDRRSGPARFARLLHPGGDAAAAATIGRVEPDAAAPVVSEAVIGGGKEA